MSLWIITVNFGNSEPTASLINSLSFLEDNELINIGIADNAASIKSTSELKKIIKKNKMEIKLFSFKKNIYYWPAVKKVIKKLKKIIGTYPDWIIVCNNDVTFSNKDFFIKLAEIDIKKYPIIGPNIRNIKGVRLNPFMISPLSKLQSFYWNIYFVSYQFSILLRKITPLFSFFCSERLKTEKSNTNKAVYAVHGSAILFSKYFFEQGGWLDDNFEMYGEEMSVAEIAKILNLPITYIPQLEVVHHEHKSTTMVDGRVLFDKAKRSHRYFRTTYKK